MSISQADRQKYTNIFYSHAPQNGKLTGELVKGIFTQSGLALSQLGEIWNLCDIDKDGCMNLDEFILAMHFIFSLLNGSIQQVPPYLPPHLIPSSKSTHLSTAPHPVQPTPQASPNVRPSTVRHKFDWHINSSDKTNYETLFNRLSRPGASTIHLQDVKGFLLEKGFSPNDLNTAWMLVDVGKTQSLAKEQFSLLLHILNSKFKGLPFPTSIPIHLSNRFLGKTAPVQAASTSSKLYPSSFSANQNRSISSGSLYGSSTVQSPRPHYTNDFYRTSSSGPLSLKQDDQTNSLDLFSFQERPIKGDEAGSSNEIPSVEKHPNSYPNATLHSKAKSELEEFLNFLERVEQSATECKALLEPSNPEFTELEKLAQEIEAKDSKLNSLLVQKKRELEGLHLELNKIKYGV